jgi:hypothetical protein
MMEGGSMDFADLQWRESADTYYYYEASSGRLLGTVFKWAAQNVIWNAKVFKTKIPYDNDSEVHLGQFVGADGARRALEAYWLRETRTLLS